MSTCTGRKEKYVVFVPPEYFEKVSSTEKTTIYKCLVGCANKTISVNNTTLCNARRHFEVDLHFKAFLLSTTVRYLYAINLQKHLETAKNNNVSLCVFSLLFHTEIQEEKFRRVI